MHQAQDQEDATKTQWLQVSRGDTYSIAISSWLSAYHLYLLHSEKKEQKMSWWHFLDSMRSENHSWTSRDA